MLESTGGAATTAVHSLCAVASAREARHATRRAEIGEDAEQIIHIDSAVGVDVGAARTGTTEVREDTKQVVDCGTARSTRTSAQELNIHPSAQVVESSRRSCGITINSTVRVGVFRAGRHRPTADEQLGRGRGQRRQQNGEAHHGSKLRQAAGGN